MISSAVRALHYQQVRSRREVRILEDGSSGPAEVTAEEEYPLAAGFEKCEFDLGGAKYVSGFEKPEAYTAEELEWSAVGNRNEAFQSLHDIVNVVERTEERQFFLRPLFVQILYIVFLYVSAVRKHDGSKIPGSESTQDYTIESFLHCRRQITGMIDMSM